MESKERNMLLDLPIQELPVSDEFKMFMASKMPEIEIVEDLLVLHAPDFVQHGITANLMGDLAAIDYSLNKRGIGTSLSNSMLSQDADMDLHSIPKHRLNEDTVDKLSKKALLENEKKKLIEELESINELFGPLRPAINPMEVLKHYFMAAFFTEEEELEGASISDLSNKAKLSSLKDIEKFIDKAGMLLNGIEASQVGHDLWLTRNGHGTGFWDRGLGEVGENLSDIARGMGEKHIYKGDDGKIYID